MAQKKRLWIIDKKIMLEDRGAERCTRRNTI